MSKVVLKYTNTPQHRYIYKVVHRYTNIPQPKYISSVVQYTNIPQPKYVSGVVQYTNIPQPRNISKVVLKYINTTQHRGTYIRLYTGTLIHLNPSTYLVLYSTLISGLESK